ncbi:MAG: Permease of the drug/metabolite transporter superfamily [Gemmatimonadetes bacterium]|nr:Permease of the drug/metabolite transporter superfamily [Gemmatimonadota bacterium]
MAQREGVDGGIAAEATGPGPGWGWTETSLLGMVLVWGANFAVVKRTLATFDPLAFNGLRFLIASLFVAAVLRAQGPIPRPDRRDVPRLVAIGILGNVLYQVAFILGLSRTAAGHASVVLALSPMFTALLSRWTGHERPGGRTWSGAALSILGIALVSSGSLRAGAPPGALVGDLILVGSAVLWAAYTVGSRPLVQRYGAVPTTAWTLWIGTPPLLLAGAPALLRQRWSGISPGAWGGLFFSACLSIGLAYLIWYRGVEKIGNTRTAIFSNLTPLVALAVSAAWLGERPSALSMVGVALTLGGVMWVRSDHGRHGAPREALAAEG